MISQAGPTRAGGSPDAQLREASRALEGVFVAQLYQAMRKTVPEGGFLDSGVGGEMFTQMFDEQLADMFAQRLSGGLGDQLYEQLRTRLSPESGSDDHG